MSKNRVWPSKGDQLLYQVKSPYQIIHFYKDANNKDYWLALNTTLQFHTAECDISHHFMGKVPLMMAKHNRNALIIGGGDGLCAKQMLKCPLQRLRQVELDGHLVALTKRHPIMRRLSEDSFNHPKNNLLVGDGIEYLLNTNETYDVIVDDCDFEATDQPDNTRSRYEKYLDCLFKKLNPGGVACIMESLVKAEKYALRNMPDSAKDREEWMLNEFLKKNHLAFWKEKTPYVKYALIDLPYIGPEAYIYISNQPI